MIRDIIRIKHMSYRIVSVCILIAAMVILLVVNRGTHYEDPVASSGAEKNVTADVGLSDHVPLSEKTSSSDSLPGEADTGTSENAQIEAADTGSSENARIAEADTDPSEAARHEAEEASARIGWMFDEAMRKITSPSEEELNATWRGYKPSKVVDYSEQPRYLDYYIAPGSEDYDITRFQFILDGKAYQLPCPVKEFIDDGWEITGVDRKYIQPLERVNDVMTIGKNGCLLEVDVTNHLTDLAMPIEFCAVTSIYYVKSRTNSWNADVPDDFIRITDSIDMGVTYDSIHDRITGIGFREYNDEENGRKGYIYQDNYGLVYMAFSDKSTSLTVSGEAWSYMPEGWEHYQIHRYELVKADVTWHEAFEAALAAGGYLLHIDTDSEYEYINDLMKKEGEPGVSYYIGGGKNYYDYDFKWVMPGFYLEDMGSLNRSPYWIGDEPSFEGEGSDGNWYYEDRMDLIWSETEGRWGYNDIPGDPIQISEWFKGKLGYIIEFEE